MWNPFGYAGGLPAMYHPGLYGWLYGVPMAAPSYGPMIQGEPAIFLPTAPGWLERRGRFLLGETAYFQGRTVKLEFYKKKVSRE